MNRGLVIGAVAAGVLAVGLAVTGVVVVTAAPAAKPDETSAAGHRSSAPARSRPSPTPTATPTPSASSRAQPSAPIASAPSPAAPAAPSCPTGQVEFSVYDGNLTPLHAADGSISGYSATVVIRARNATTAAVHVDIGAGAWGVDAAGQKIVPVATRWGPSTPADLFPGQVAGGTGQNPNVTPEQGAAVIRWISANAGHAVVRWSGASPAGCPAVPTVVDK